VGFFRAYLTIACLASVVVTFAQGEPFTFAGFRLDMDLATLLDKYPQSSHELSPGAGARRRTSQDDLKAWIREVFRDHGSGTYIVRLAPGESHDHLYYVQAEVREGVPDRLWLSFEMPLDLVKSRRGAGAGNETRYPPCEEVLGPLTAKYGKPQARPPQWEESLEFFEYRWTRAPETLQLECGRYESRKAIFALKVTLEKPGVR
jgi:hypothetical protein